MKSKTHRYVVILSVAGVVLIVLQVLFSIQARADQQKEDDISILHNSIENYSYNNRRLPARLDELKDLCDKSLRNYLGFGRAQPAGVGEDQVYLPGKNNPDTNSNTVAPDKCVKSRLNNYEYKVVDPQRYELCATFHRNTLAKNLNPYTKNNNLEYTQYQHFDEHDSGKYCFRLKAYIDNYKNIDGALLPTSSPTPSNTSSQKGTPSTSDVGSATPDGTLRPLNAMVADMMNFLITYKNQKNEYPLTQTEDMDKLLWKYKYNFASGGPILKCPADASLFTYNGYKNQSTGKMDTFELFFCDGSTMKKKTEADIVWN